MFPSTASCHCVGMWPIQSTGHADGPNAMDWTGLWVGRGHFVRENGFPFFSAVCIHRGTQCHCALCNIIIPLS